MAYQKSRGRGYGRRSGRGAYKAQNSRTYGRKRSYGARTRSRRTKSRGQTLRIVIEQPQAMMPMYSGVKLPRGARF